MAVVLLFDIDGTLVSCGGAGKVAMRAAFKEMVGRDDVCEFDFAGMTDRLIARLGFTAAGVSADAACIDALLDRYLPRLEASLRTSERFKVFEGVQDILRELVDRDDVALGLGTGNVESGARQKLARGGLGDEFLFGGFGCDHEDRHEVIAAGIKRGKARLAAVSQVASEVWVIGDTPRDVQAARANGARCLGVATGPFSAEELMEAGANLTVETLADTRVLPMLLSR